MKTRSQHFPVLRLWISVCLRGLFLSESLCVYEGYSSLNLSVFTRVKPHISRTQPESEKSTVCSLMSNKQERSVCFDSVSWRRSGEVLMLAELEKVSSRYLRTSSKITSRGVFVSVGAVWWIEGTVATWQSRNNILYIYNTYEMIYPVSHNTSGLVVSVVCWQ